MRPCDPYASGMDHPLSPLQPFPHNRAGQTVFGKCHLHLILSQQSGDGALAVGGVGYSLAHKKRILREGWPFLGHKGLSHALGAGGGVGGQNGHNLLGFVPNIQRFGMVAAAVLAKGGGGTSSFVVVLMANVGGGQFLQKA